MPGNRRVFTVVVFDKHFYRNSEDYGKYACECTYICIIYIFIAWLYIKTQKQTKKPTNN